jgi:hypothetical protein
VKKICIYTLLAISSFHVAVVHSQWSKGKYAGSFLETGVGARALGMGGAHVAVANDVTSIYWNPAGLAWMTMLQIHGMHAERFSGVVNWDFLGIASPVRENMSFGLGFFRLGVDGIPITSLRDPSRALGEIYYDESGKRVRNDPIVEKIVNDNEMAFLLSFALKKNRIAYGANVKVIRKSVGEYGAWGIGFDAGLMIRTFHALQVGVTILDATSTLLAWKGGQKELIRPHAKFGIAYPFKVSQFHILPLLDTHIGLENRGSNSQFNIGTLEGEIGFGLEVDYVNRVAFRIGLDRGQLTTGAGFSVSAFRLDYGFADHFDLGNTHRISLTVSWDKQLLLKL